MYLSFGSIGFICVAIAFVWFWQDSLRARDFANAAAMSACERMGLQFLDGTAAFSGLRFARVEGRFSLRRTYVFDYTSQSIERRQGFVILVGSTIEYVGFASEQTAQPAAPSASQSTPTEAIDAPRSAGEADGKVVDFDVHRARLGRRRTH
jgi:hypothetical protein